MRIICNNLNNIITLNKENCLLFPRTLNNLCFCTIPNYKPTETIFFMKSTLRLEISLMQEISSTYQGMYEAAMKKYMMHRSLKCKKNLSDLKKIINKIYD